MSLEIRTPGEAFYLAAEMEKRAIRLYERALLIFSQGPCRAYARCLTFQTAQAFWRR